MKLSEQEHVKEVSEEFTKAVRAMRAIKEHAGKVKASFGSEDMLPGVHPHNVEIEPADREYGQVVALLRVMLVRRVGELAEQLRDLGVDTNA